MIVRFTHGRTARSGREYVVTELRRKYWIIGVRGLVKRALRRCVTYRGQGARPCEQQMGDLPPDRVTHGGPAFMSVGIDYLGPITVKRDRGQEKRYGCLFTCLSSRVVRGLVDRALRRCVTYRRQDARPCEQQMGHSPPRQ